jgi:hypothetical protein
MFLWLRRFRLVQRRTVWCPTWFAVFFTVGLLLVVVSWWWRCGETFLSSTQRSPAEILVVEGWIGPEGVRAAAEEFEQRGYRYIIATGGLTTNEGWEQAGSNYAEMAGRELIRSGVSKDKIIVAPARDAKSRRTYESAVAVWQALQARGIQANALNVFTFGPHARRSRLVFAKVCQPATQVGVVDWAPSRCEGAEWWRSSERAKELLTETAGYAYEILLNSGRGSDSPRSSMLQGPGDS